MFKIEVLVTLKKDVLDPQGKAIELAAKNINLKNIYSVKQNKYFEVLVEKVPSQEKAKEIVEKLSKNLLANEVIEDFKITSCKKDEPSIIVFPGSNCDNDIFNSIKNIYGFNPNLIWYQDTIPKGTDLIIIPGGFLFW